MHNAKQLIMKPLTIIVVEHGSFTHFRNISIYTHHLALFDLFNFFKPNSAVLTLKKFHKFDEFR